MWGNLLSAARYQNLNSLSSVSLEVLLFLFWFLSLVDAHVVKETISPIPSLGTISHEYIQL